MIDVDNDLSLDGKRKPFLDHGMMVIKESLNEGNSPPERHGPDHHLQRDAKKHYEAEEERRRKLQKDWRNKAKEIRKSQLLEESQEDYYLSRSRSYLMKAAEDKNYHSASMYNPTQAYDHKRVS
jgi:hypothetical protein